MIGKHSSFVCLKFNPSCCTSIIVKCFMSYSGEVLSISHNCRSIVTFSSIRPTITTICIIVVYEFDLTGKIIFCLINIKIYFNLNSSTIIILYVYSIIRIQHLLNGISSLDFNSLEAIFCNWFFDNFRFHFNEYFESFLQFHTSPKNDCYFCVSSYQFHRNRK